MCSYNLGNYKFKISKITKNSALHYIAFTKVTSKTISFLSTETGLKAAKFQVFSEVKSFPNSHHL